MRGRTRLHLVLVLAAAATAACTSEGPIGPAGIVAADAAAWGSRSCGGDGGSWYGDLAHQPATWVQVSRITAQDRGSGTISVTIDVQTVWREDIALEGARVKAHRSQVDASQAVLESGAKLLVGIVDYPEPRPYATELIGFDSAGGIGFVGACGEKRTEAFAAFAEREGATSGVDLLRAIISNPDGPIARRLAD